MADSKSKANPPAKIAIVGGGIGGLLLGSALLKHGCTDFHVYERGVADDVLRQGYQLRVSQYGVDAMKECLDPDIYWQLCTKFTPNAAPGPVIVNAADCSPMVRLGDYKSYTHTKAISRFAVRGAFIKRVEQAGKISYKKRLLKVQVIDQKTQRLRLDFDDGSHTEADIVIAADGSKSFLRAETGLPESEVIPRWINLSYRRAVTPEIFSRLSKVIREDRIQMVASYGFNTFVSLYQHPSAEDLNYADVAPPQALANEQPTLPVGATHPDDTLFCAFVTPDDVVRYKEGAPAKYYYDAIARHFAEHPERYDASFTSLLEIGGEKMDQFLVGQFRHSLPPTADWRERRPTADKPLYAHPRVFFVGDSMHSMPPGRGMGANTSSADAALLAPMLVELINTGGSADVETVRTTNMAYEKAMIPRAFAWVTASVQAFKLDTKTWIGAIGLRIYLGILTIGHYWVNLQQMFGFHKSVSVTF